MNKIVIFGHKNPDTDSIASSIIMKEFMNKIDKNEYEAVSLGSQNKETEYMLNHFNIEKPKIIENLDGIENVILVDHNEFSQSATGIENVIIQRVVDHHRIKEFETAGPLYYRAEPVGCTATVLYKMYIESNIEITREIAGLMISAIISDTLLFKSPTCTNEDVVAAKELEKISGINVQEYGLEMLKAGTDLSDYSAEQLISIDAKETMLKDVKAIIAQVNTVDIDEMLKRKTEIEEAMKKTIEEKGLEIMFFAITDIINSNTQAIVLGEKSDIVQRAYGKNLIDNTMFLEGVVSRKKQILPILTENV